MPKTTRITTAWLKRHKACDLDLFTATFPDGAEVTAANIRRAASAGLDLHWFARSYLPTPDRKRYNEEIVQARTQYDEETTPDRKRYNEEIVQARKRLNEDIVQARKRLNEAIAPARKRLNEETAQLLITILGLQEE